MKTLCLALLLLLLAGCGLMSPQQQADGLAALDEMLRTGSITQAQYAALREALLAGGQVGFWKELGLTIGSAALAYAGIQLRRGPVEPKEMRVERVKAAQAKPAT